MASLKSGSSEDVIEHNIMVLMAQGYSENAAVKAAMRLARGSRRPVTAMGNPIDRNAEQQATARYLRFTDGIARNGADMSSKVRKYGTLGEVLRRGGGSTLDQQLGEIESYTRGLSRISMKPVYENPISTKGHIMKHAAVYENPISPMQWYLIAAAVAGVGVVAYEMMKKPAATTTAANAITLQAGAQSATVGAGLTINLPSGATWAQGFQGAGTSTPLQVPAATPGQSQTTTLGWVDSTGVTQTTQLTLTA